MAKGPRYKGFNYGQGDASNSPVVELIVGGQGTATFPRALHVAQASDADSDWAITATAHPVFFLHSGTNATTEYISMTHDATCATINAQGATNLNMQISGTSETILSATVFDLAGVNLQMQTSGEILDNNANQLITFPAAIASAIENVQINNAVAGGNAEIVAITSATNAGLMLDTSGTGQIVFQLGGTDTLNVHDVTGVSFVAATATIGHPLFMQTEDGGVGCTSNNGAAGALWNVQTGDGGAGFDTNNRAGGAGGAMTLQTGAGGAGSACTTATAGAGGALCILSGVGGAGATACTGDAGAGGAISITGGNAGAVTASTSTIAVGGTVTLTGGVGSTTNVASDVAGAGAAVTIVAGKGGNVAANCTTAGAGGDLILRPGAGGDETSGTTTTGGAAGLLSLRVATVGCGDTNGAAGRIHFHNSGGCAIGVQLVAEGACTWTDVNLGVGHVYAVTGWVAGTASPAGTGVLVIETS